MGSRGDGRVEDISELQVPTVKCTAVNVARIKIKEKQNARIEDWELVSEIWETKGCLCTIVLAVV